MTSTSTKSNPQHQTNPGDRSRRLKITVVGDGNVGKTCLLMSYTVNKFPEEYLPTVFDTHPMQINVDGVEFPVTLWDTAGQEDYARLRPLSYPKTDCFIVCYAVDNPTSFENVKSIWIPELRKYCPHAAVLLVGTKMDLIVPESESHVPKKDAKKLKSRINAQACLECSAKTRENLDTVFIEAVRAVMRQKASRKFQCVFL